MKANVGDWIVVQGPATGHGRREGLIVALRHPDGEPPYEVRWSDTGKTTLVFPGPDMHLRHPEQQSRSAG